MTKSVKQTLRLSFCFLIILLLSSTLLFYVVRKPDSTIGFNVFRIIYSVPIPKDFILQNFVDVWDKYNYGFVGAPISLFLDAKLETTDSETEKDALIDFNIREALERKRGGFIETSSEENKQKIIELIFSRLDSYEPQKAMGALLVIEYLRTGKALCVASIQPNRFSDSPELREEEFTLYWRDWWQQIGLSRAKAKYREWWNMNLDWQEKKQIKPLSNSAMTISEGCG